MLNNIAVLNIRMRRWPEAASALEHALVIWRRVSGTNSGAVALLANLGFVYASAGRFLEAEQTFRDAFSIAEACSDQDLDIAQLLTNYGALLRKTRLRAEAKKLELRAETIRRGRETANTLRYSIEAGDVLHVNSRNAVPAGAGKTAPVK